MSATDAATVAAVLAEHAPTYTDHAVDPTTTFYCRACSEDAGDWVTWTPDHIATALLAAPPIAQALAAVEAVARVEALADEWVDALAKGKCPDGECGSCARGEDADDLRAALRPSDAE